MPTLYTFHGRIVDLRRFSNVHQLYGRRPLGPSDRYEIWIKDRHGDERKFTVNTRTMPARRGHEVSLIITPNKARRVVGLGNWSTVDAVNYVRVDPPGLLRVADVAVVLAILVSMTVTLGGAGAALSVPVAFAYLSANLPGAAASSVSVFAAVFGMLWPRASEVRRTSLNSYNPYRAARATDPAVVRELLLRRTVQTVDLSAPDWKETLYAAFAADGACRLRASTAQARDLRAALVLLGATPADVGVLQFFPVVERIQRGEDCILVDLLLREHA